MATSDKSSEICLRERPRWRLALCERDDSSTTSLFVRLESVGFLDRWYGVSMDPAVLMQLVADLLVLYRYLALRRVLRLAEPPEAILAEFEDCTKHYRFKLYEDRTPEGDAVHEIALHPQDDGEANVVYSLLLDSESLVDFLNDARDVMTAVLVYVNGVTARRLHPKAKRQRSAKADSVADAR
jgi:hypothetical protein